MYKSHGTINLCCFHFDEIKELFCWIGNDSRILESHPSNDLFGNDLLIHISFAGYQELVVKGKERLQSLTISTSE